MSRRKYNFETISKLVVGENPFTQWGYEPEKIIRKVGEEFVEKGITWKKTSYGKVRINKQADSIRNLLKRICKVCGRNLDLSKDRLDDKTFPKTGKCYECLEKEEMVLRLTEKFTDYEKLKVLKNKLGLLKDFKEKVIESINFLKNDSGKMGLVMPTGEVITWTGESNKNWLKDAEVDFIKVNKEIEKITKEIEEVEKNVR